MMKSLMYGEIRELPNVLLNLRSMSHQIVSGDWSNLGGRIDLDLTGMSNAQFQVFLSRVIDYINSKN